MGFNVRCTTLLIGSYPFFFVCCLFFFVVAGDPVLPTAVVARIFHVMLMSVWDSHIFGIRKVIPRICFAPPPQKKNN